MSITGTDEWVSHVFQLIDGRRFDELLAHLASDIEWRMTNSPPQVGLADVRQMLEEGKKLVRGMHHEITGIWRGSWSEGNVVSAETWVTYERLDGSILTLPATSTLRLRGDLIARYQVFMDLPARPSAD